jgi:hypothetical protein
MIVSCVDTVFKLLSATAHAVWALCSSLNGRTLHPPFVTNGTTRTTIHYQNLTARKGKLLNPHREGALSQSAFCCCIHWHNRRMRMTTQGCYGNAPDRATGNAIWRSKPPASIYVFCFSVSPKWMAHASQATARDQDLDRTAAHRDKSYPGHYREEMRRLAHNGFRRSAFDRH